MPTFRKTFLTACLIAARSQNAKRFEIYGDFREEVWVNPKLIRVAQRRETDDYLFTGSSPTFKTSERSTKSRIF